MFSCLPGVTAHFFFLFFHYSLMTV